MNVKSLLLENISPKQTVLKNSFWIGLTQFLSRLLKLVLVIFSARVLGPSGFGTFNYVLAIMSLYFLFSDWGVNTLIVRDYQQQPNSIHRRINAALFLKLITLGASFLAALAGIFIFESVAFRQVAVLLSVFLVLEQGKEFFNSLFRAQQKMEKEFLVNLVEIVLTVAAGILLVLIQRSVISLSLAYLLGALAGFLLAIGLLKNYLPRLWPSFDKELLRYFFVNGLPLALFGLLGYVFFSSDQVVLGYFKGTENVGFYSVASRAVFVVNTLAGVVMGALYPYLASRVDNRALMKKLFPLAILFFLILGSLAALVSSVFSPLLPLVFGREYLQSVPIFQLLVWILVFMFPTVFLDHFLLAYNRQWQNFLITAGCALFDLVLNLIFIPQYGMLGAGLSSIFGQLLNFGVSLALGWQILNTKQQQI